MADESSTNPYEPPAASTHDIPPNTYLWQSMVLTVFCVMPFGLPALLYASSIESKWATGDRIGAHEAARIARKLCLLGLGFGLLIMVAYAVLIAALPKVFGR
jgi:hypothetical protein